jgi:hypothetical protein
MRAVKQVGPAEINKSRELDIESNIHELTGTVAALHQPENSNDETSANNLGTLLRRVSEATMREIEKLIDQLHGLRKELETDGDRIQSDIVRYVELGQGVMQLTTIISDNMKRLSPGAGN